MKSQGALIIKQLTVISAYATIGTGVSQYVEQWAWSALSEGFFLKIGFPNERAVAPAPPVGEQKNPPLYKVSRRVHTRAVRAPSLPPQERTASLHRRKGSDVPQHFPLFFYLVRRLVRCFLRQFTGCLQRNKVPTSSGESGRSEPL